MTACETGEPSIWLYHPKKRKERDHGDFQWLDDSPALVVLIKDAGLLTRDDPKCRGKSLHFEGHYFHVKNNAGVIFQTAKIDELGLRARKFQLVRPLQSPNSDYSDELPEGYVWLNDLGIAVRQDSV
jgi:hypothetical protein